MLFHLASCNITDEQNDASSNKSDGVTLNEMQKDSTTEKKKEFKEIEEIKPPKKIDKKTFILGTWTASKAGRDIGKMKFSKNGEWYGQRNNKSSWKNNGKYKLSKDCKSITIGENGRTENLVLETYTAKKIIIVVDQRDLKDNIVLTK